MNYNPSAENIALFLTGTSLSDEDVVLRIAKTGDVYADGAFHGTGADFAERFEVIGEAAAYEAGDVLVISVDSDRHLERASEPYSSLVAGVYAAVAAGDLSLTIEGALEVEGTFNPQGAQVSFSNPTAASR